LDGLLIGRSFCRTAKTTFTDLDRTTLDMERDNSFKCLKERIITSTSMQLVLKRIKEERLHKRWDDLKNM
jgi:hypothetical protein